MIKSIAACLFVTALASVALGQLQTMFTIQSVIPILVAVIIAVPGLLTALVALFQIYRAKTSINENTELTKQLANSVKDFTSHVNSKMDTLIETVRESALLKGASDERLRRDGQDLAAARANPQLAQPVEVKVTNPITDPVPTVGPKDK